MKTQSRWRSRQVAADGNEVVDKLCFKNNFFYKFNSPRSRNYPNHVHVISHFWCRTVSQWAPIEAEDSPQTTTAAAETKSLINLISIFEHEPFMN